MAKKSLVLALALLALVAGSARAGTVAPPRYDVMFKNFKAAHSKSYATAVEEAHRFRVFVQNMKKAAQLMKSNPQAAFGANEFADMTAAEFKVRHSGEKVFAQKLAARAKSNVAAWAPSKAQLAAAAGQAIDWRTKGAVTAIKNQGQCGSCWSFSSTGSIEGQWFLAGNTLTSVSEQELVSCDTVDDGCNGGLMDNAWGWLLSAEKGQIVTEASYPYVSGGGSVPACSLAGTTVGSTISGHEDVTTTEVAMAAWSFANGPLSIAVDATSWQTYVSGIMTNCISSQIDHGVLIVGFDSTYSTPYWIIKNSWGASWGENGYIRVQMGTDQCLITSLPCSSKVAGGPAPTTAAPSGGATFTQRTCKDDKCSKCTDDVLPQGTCIAGGASSSFKATCIKDGLLINNYMTAGCTGSFSQTVAPINQCSIVFQKDKAFEWIENVCSSGPAPPSPPTVAPTTAAPAGNGTLVQEQCSDAACSQGCSNYTFQLGVCLQLSGGGSAIATCNSQGVLLTEYITSNTCTGPSIPSQQSVDQCLQDSDGTYFENFCLPASAPPRGAAAKAAAAFKKLAKKF